MILFSHFRRKRGFTLIELLVVITVMGVLASIVLVVVNPGAQLAKIRNTQRKSDLRTLANALERYYSYNGFYPSTGGAWCTTSIGVSGVSYQCTNNAIQTLVTVGSLKKLPTDPKAGQPNPMYTTGSCMSGSSNSYLYRSDGTDYKLLAHCSVEGESLGSTFSSSDPFYDPNRPQHAWKISTPGGNW